MTAKSWARSHINPGLRHAIGRMRDELKIAIAHHRSLRKAARLPAQKLRLNCGCGPNVKPGWINIDLDPATDLQLDLRRPLPFREDSVMMVYSEHFFEHLEYPAETEVFLSESLRVLEPGGVFRVGIPDAEWPVRAYAAGEDDEYFRLAREQWHPGWCDTRMHHINYHFRQGSEHKYAYDYETLERVLTRTGFGSVRRVDFNPEFDSEVRAVGTLYVEGRKN